MFNLWLDCGKHKTGTTARQFVFAAHRARLLASGIFYPDSLHAGNPKLTSGHHNLAWELTDDPRFDPAGLTWDKVIVQISLFEGDVLLSSEDFESLLHRRDVISSIVQRLRATGRNVCLIIYERERNDYAESLYFELVKHGYDKPFDAYFQEIKSTGFLVYQAWVFQFDLERTLAGLRAIPGLRVEIRPYRNGASDGVVSDFLTVIGLPPSMFGEAVMARQNERASVAASVTSFVANIIRRPLSLEESIVIKRLCPRFVVPWSIANPPWENTESAGPDGPTHYLRVVFSTFTADAICKIASSSWRREVNLLRLSSIWQCRRFAGILYSISISSGIEYTSSTPVRQGYAAKAAPETLVWPALRRRS